MSSSTEWTLVKRKDGRTGGRGGRENGRSGRSGKYTAQNETKGRPAGSVQQVPSTFPAPDSDSHASTETASTQTARYLAGLALAVSFMSN